MSSNSLASLEGLPEGCANLHELYASDNRLRSLAGLAKCAPNLETLVRRAGGAAARGGGRKGGRTQGRCKGGARVVQGRCKGGEPENGTSGMAGWACGQASRCTRQFGGLEGVSAGVWCAMCS